MSPERRPDPDELLARVKEEESRQTRGKLKIFFGAAAGVGKTYAMLEAAREQRDRGTTLQELDLDAALARRPGLLLVDELAHTNAPGSRHAKRWQDVLEVLEAGINVQAREAIENFFRKGNLIALRELALRVTAQHVDAEIRHYMRDHAFRGTWPVRERLLVCVGPSPYSIRLVRAAKRMAEGLGAVWIVAYVETPAQTRLPQEARDRVAQTMHLAEQLGAETHTLTGPRMSDEILAFARARNVSKIVVGKPERPLWKRIVMGPIGDTLVQGSGEIDVYVISGDRDDSRPMPPGRPTGPRSPRARSRPGSRG
jgi:two-component system sensor histidine kinase KdpD